MKQSRDFRVTGRFIAMVIAVVLLLTLVPMSVLAEDGPSQPVPPCDCETLCDAQGSVSAASATDGAGAAAEDSTNTDCAACAADIALCVGAPGQSPIVPQGGPVAITIDAFAEGADSIAVAYGTVQDGISFPVLTANGGELTLEGVIWECETYDGNTPDEYVFTPVIPADQYTIDAASLPAVTVAVGEEATPPPEFEQLLEYAKQDPQRAAELLGEITEEQAYTLCLKAILNYYYESEQWELLDVFTEHTDERAAELLQSYADAAVERAAWNLGYVPGEVLVVFEEVVSEPQAEAVVEELDGAVTETLDTPTPAVEIVAEIDLSQTVEQAVAEYEADPAVDYAQPNYLYEPTEMTETQMSTQAYSFTDPKAAEQWQLNAIGLPEAWEILNNDPFGARFQVKVAVLDTPFDFGHEDFDRTTVNKTYRDYTYFLGPETPSYQHAADPDMHGTHVAGIIAASASNGKGGVGVASARNNGCVELIPVNVFAWFKGTDDKGNTVWNLRASTDVITKAITRLADDGAKVINLSLGGPSGSSDATFDNAINYAVSKGCTVVCAAGNSETSATYYPSDSPNAISVIALDQSLKRASYSNYGPAKDISAPGSFVLSTIPDTYAKASGTSMAAPVVTGVAALVLCRNNTLTPQQVKDILYTSATDLGTPGKDDQYGNGLVDAAQAVKNTPTIGALQYQQIDMQDKQLTFDDAGVKMDITTIPAVGAAEPLKWESSDAGVVTVDSKGALTTTGVGTATVTVTATRSGVTASATVSVSPGAPSNVQANLGSVVYSAAISFNEVPESGGYLIYRSENTNGPFELIKVLPGNKTGYIDETFPYPGTFYYKVASCQNYSLDGDYGLQSPMVSAHAPVNITAARFAISDLTFMSSRMGNVTLAWQSNLQLGFTVSQYNKTNGQWDVLAETEKTSHTINGLDSAETYQIKVESNVPSGWDGGELGATSATIEVATMLPAAGGFDVATGAAPLDVDLSWNAVAGADGYCVYKKNPETGKFELCGETETPSYTDTVSDPAVAGEYFVESYREVSDVKLGSESSATLSQTAMPGVENLTSQAVAGGVLLSWNPCENTGIGGYDILRAYEGISVPTESADYEEYQKVGRVEGRGTTTFTDTGVDVNMDYSYKVLPYAIVSGVEYTGAEALVSARPGSGGASTRNDTSDTTTVRGGVSTGDESNISLWIALLMAAGVSIMGILTYRRRRDNAGS
ncbi:S8 family serine peptidase [Christensenellaceae bacterium OttesenSCG-928-K19]|nr:S8 family serine peptidase [Christensenellaceae bacterium OttesenSCG-928-K19]